jgi:hypothetical protein
MQPTGSKPFANTLSKIEVDTYLGAVDLSLHDWTSLQARVLRGWPPCGCILSRVGRGYKQCTTAFVVWKYLLVSVLLRFPGIWRES